MTGFVQYLIALIHDCKTTIAAMMLAHGITIPMLIDNFPKFWIAITSILSAFIGMSLWRLQKKKLELENELLRKKINDSN
jgi:hypothetical protein